MGRKRSRREETRTQVVSARLTNETYELVTEHAERMGLTRAGYIEHIIENKPLRIVRGAMDELSVPLINELKRIGNNLNQIAHARNAGSDVDPRHFHSVLADIIRVLCRNELTRKHYADAYTEVVGSARDDAAVDPAKRSLPAPVVSEKPVATPEEKPSGQMPSRAPAALNDNTVRAHAPYDLRGAGIHPQPPMQIPWPEVRPQQLAPPARVAHAARIPWSESPNTLSSVDRHDPSPQSAWSKLLRRLQLRAS